MRSTAGTGISRPTPTTIPVVADPDPPPSSSQSAVLNSSDLAILRLRLPNLAGMSDAFLQRTSLADLTALHSVSAATPHPRPPLPTNPPRPTMQRSYLYLLPPSALTTPLFRLLPMIASNSSILAVSWLALCAMPDSFGWLLRLPSAHPG